MIEKIDSIVATINRWVMRSLVSVACVLVVVWMCLIVTYCFGRFTGTYVWMFVEEYTGYFFLATSSLGLAYAAAKGAHIRVPILAMRLPKRARLILECSCLAVCVWWAVLLTQKMSTWFSHALSVGEVSVVSNLPLWIPYLILVTGCAALALAALALFYHAVRTAAWSSQSTENRGNGAGEL